MSSNEEKVLLLCVNYQNDGETLAFLKNVLANDRAGRVRIAVADNTIRSDIERILFEQAAESLSRYVCVTSENANLGYFGGLNAAFKKANIRYSETLFRCVVLSNTDIEFSSENFFDKLVEVIALRSHASTPDTIGLIAPMIQSSRTGANQNPLYRRKPSRGKFSYLSAIYSVYSLGVAHRLLSKVKNFVRRKLDLDKFELEDEEIYAGHGSFMVLLNEYFARGGQLGYPEFLFCEEIFVAEQCASLGLTTLFCPSLRVVHRENATTGLLPSRKIVAYLQRSHLYCRDTYF